MRRRFVLLLFACLELTLSPALLPAPAPSRISPIRRASHHPRRPFPFSPALPPTSRPPTHSISRIPAPTRCLQPFSSPQCTFFSRSRPALPVQPMRSLAPLSLYRTPPSLPSIHCDSQFPAESPHFLSLLPTDPTQTLPSSLYTARSPTPPALPHTPTPTPPRSNHFPSHCGLRILVSLLRAHRVFVYIRILLIDKGMARWPSGLMCPMLARASCSSAGGDRIAGLPEARERGRGRLPLAGPGADPARPSRPNPPSSVRSG